MDGGMDGLMDEMRDEECKVGGVSGNCSCRLCSEISLARENRVLEMALTDVSFG